MACCRSHFNCDTFRFSKDLSYSAKEQRCHNVIAELGLVEAADTIVGGNVRGREVRGVSGGERKRVAIGIELLYGPKILFLDEPTSGLDSFQALNVMSYLSECSSQPGRLVMCSIHQPRSAIFQQLSHIILLSQGEQLNSLILCSPTALRGHPLDRHCSISRPEKVLRSFLQRCELGGC